MEEQEAEEAAGQLTQHLTNPHLTGGGKKIRFGNILGNDVVELSEILHEAPCAPKSFCPHTFLQFLHDLQ